MDKDLDPTFELVEDDGGSAGIITIDKSTEWLGFLSLPVGNILCGLRRGQDGLFELTVRVRIVLDDKVGPESNDQKTVWRMGRLGKEPELAVGLAKFALSTIQTGVSAAGNDPKLCVLHEVRCSGNTTTARDWLMSKPWARMIATPMVPGGDA